MRDNSLKRISSVTPASRRATKKPASPKPRAKKKSAPVQEPGLGFRSRTTEDDSFILQLTEAQLGAVHQQAFGEAFPREQFLRYLQSGAPTVVVQKGKKRIGYYSYLIGPDGKMHVSAMVIEPAYQSEGVGSQVMAHLEQDAKSRGVHTMEVFVQANNEKSVAFTRKLGFIERYRMAPNTICFQKVIAEQPQVPGQGMGLGMPPQMGMPEFGMPQIPQNSVVPPTAPQMARNSYGMPPLE